MGNLYCLNLKEVIKEKKLPTYIIKDQSYISLKSLLKAINPESWGKIEDRVFLIYNGTEIKFRIGTEIVKVDKKTITLNYPPKEIEGEILIPLNDFSSIISMILSIDNLFCGFFCSIDDTKFHNLSGIALSLYRVPEKMFFMSVPTLSPKGFFLVSSS